MNENPLWLNNELQFARLLCEIVAAQDDLDIEALKVSMDLQGDQVSELFDRAHDIWEGFKEKS